MPKPVPAHRSVHIDSCIRDFLAGPEYYAKPPKYADDGDQDAGDKRDNMHRVPATVLQGP